MVALVLDFSTYFTIAIKYFCHNLEMEQAAVLLIWLEQLWPCKGSLLTLLEGPQLVGGFGPFVPGPTTVALYLRRTWLTVTLVWFG